jgi:hypothetical protein
MTPVSRGWQLGVGIAAILFGAPSFGFGLFALSMLRSSDADDRLGAIIVATIFLTFGTPVLIAGLRLVFARPRMDEGLFSPFFLRVAGVVILALPVFFFVLGDVLHGVMAVMHIGAASACFALAAYRAKRR